MMWKDASNWSQRDSAEVRKTPTSWEVKSGALSVTLHHYVGCGDAWFFSCYELGIKARPLASKHVKVAAKQALSIVKEAARKLAADARALTKVEWP